MFPAGLTVIWSYTVCVCEPVFPTLQLFVSGGRRSILVSGSESIGGERDGRKEELVKGS